MTDRVNHPDRTRTTHRALEALAAADVYATRLVAGLREISLTFSSGDHHGACEELSGAVAGIRCLADILATVGAATGIETPPSTDHELGRIALSLQRIDEAKARRDCEQVARIIDEELVPGLARLAPTFPLLESRIAALA